MRSRENLRDVLDGLDKLSASAHETFCHVHVLDVLVAQLLSRATPKGSFKEIVVDKTDLELISYMRGEATHRASETRKAVEALLREAAAMVRAGE